MINSLEVEQLAGAIAQEIYLDIAKWRLYLGAAKLDQQLAQQFVALEGLSLAQVQAVLQSTSIPIGGGKKHLPLADLIPDAMQTRLYQILQEFLAD